MNTDGHHDVADSVGLELLKQAFPNRRLEAFYLGNWLTDLSQVVDPVAFENVTQKATSWISDAMDAIQSPVCNIVDMTSLLTCNEQYLNDLKKKVTNNILGIFDNLFKPKPPNTTSTWYEIAKAGILMKGYFKFVHPEHANEPLRMDLESYIHVVTKQFTQYYPHEHLDRPAVAVPAPHAPDKAIYDDRRATGPRNSAASGQPATLDLYTYLRDDIELIAGRLTALDMNWAKKFLTTVSVPDSDKEWNLGLAQLGQALHGVEDYFAHSNFVDLAAPVFGETFLPMNFEFFRKRRYLKRLRRYDPQKVDDDVPPFVNEDYVVTGYFDFQDTAISLLHLMEHIVPGVFDIELRDITADLRYSYDAFMDVDGTDQKINKEVSKFINDWLDIIDDPTKLNLENNKNEVVKALTKIINGQEALDDAANLIDQMRGEKVQAANVIALLRQMPLFKPLINEMDKSPLINLLGLKILQAFIDLIWFLQLKPEIGNLIKSSRELLKELEFLFADPFVWLADQAEDQVIKRAIGYSAYIGLELIYDHVGLNRVGCHSLLAKDHGGEVLYDQMKACCKAVHYYVVTTLLRWQQNGGNNQIVDWLELLEHFLSNPIDGILFTAQKQVFVSTPHKIEPADLKQYKGNLRALIDDIVDHYKNTVVMPTGLPPERTLKPSDILNELLGMKIRKKAKEVNFVKIAEDHVIPEFAPNLAVALKLRRLIIPYIQTTVTTCPSTPNRWYVPIFTNPENFAEWNMIHDNWQHDHTLRFVSDAAAQAYITKTSQMRTTLQDTYNLMGQRYVPAPN